MWSFSKESDSKHDSPRRAESIVSSSSSRKPEGSAAPFFGPQRSFTTPGTTSYGVDTNDRSQDSGSRHGRSNSMKERDRREERSRSRDKDDGRRKHRSRSRESDRRKHRSRSRDRDHKKHRSRSGDRDDRRHDKKERHEVKERKRTRSSRTSTENGTAGVVGDGSSGVVLSQSPDQLSGTYVGSSGNAYSQAAPVVASPSSHVVDQFPGQFPQQSTEPYRPPLAANEGGPGLAAEYYGDLGQSVADQPGVRPHRPSLIVGAEPHLMAASPVAAPPVEPSATGEIGAAASFYGGSLGSKPSTPGLSPRHSPKPGKPSKISPATGVGAAALTYAVSGGSGNHTSSYQQPSAEEATTHSSYFPSAAAPEPHHHSTSAPAVPTLGAAAAGMAAGYLAGQYGRHDNHKPPSQSQGGVSYITPPSTSKPPKPGKHPSHSNSGMYAAGAAATAAGLASAHHHDHHHHPQGSHQNSYAGSSYVASGVVYHRRQRGPVDKFVDFWRDPDGVGKFEEYTEYLGVCKHCFEPGSSPKDAPRKHHYRRRGSNDRFGSSTRVDKESRYYSSDAGSSKRKGKGSWITTGLAGYGLAKVGKTLFNRTHDFDDTYSVRTGRDSESRLSLHENASRHSLDREEHRSWDVAKKHRSRSRSRSRHRDRSRDRSELGITGDGRIYKTESHGAAAQVGSRQHDKLHGHKGHRDRHTHRRRSRSNSRRGHRRKSNLAGEVGVSIGSSVEPSHSRRRSGSVSPQRAFVRKEPRTRDKSPEYISIPGPSISASHHSRPHSPRGSAVKMPNYSKESSSGILGGLFSTKAETKRRKSPTERKKKGFFNFGNSSSSSDELSSDHATIRNRESHGKRSDTKGGYQTSEAALVGLGTVAAALSAQQNAKSKHPTRRPDVLAVKAVRGNDAKLHKPRRRRSHSSASDSDNGAWESASEDDSSNADQSNLAFGSIYGASSVAAGKSQDSLVSDSSSGTDFWGWRWGRKRSREHSHAHRPKDSTGGLPSFAGAGVAGAAGAAIGASLAADPRNETAVSSGSSLPSLQRVFPVPTSDPDRFDVRRQESITSSHNQPTYSSRPAPVPLQQPQPLAPINPAMYTHASSQSSFAPPSGPPVFAQTASALTRDRSNGGFRHAHTAESTKTRPINPFDYQIHGDAWGSRPVSQDVTHQPHRRESSPTISNSIRESQPEAKRRSSLKDNAMGVRFEFSKEQQREIEKKKQREAERPSKDPESRKERSRRRESEEQAALEKAREKAREERRRNRGTDSGGQSERKDNNVGDREIRNGSAGSIAAGVAGVAAAALATKTKDSTIEPTRSKRISGSDRPQYQAVYDVQQDDKIIHEIPRYPNTTPVVQARDYTIEDYSNVPSVMDKYREEELPMSAYFAPPELLSKSNEPPKVQVYDDPTWFDAPHIVTVAPPNDPRNGSRSSDYSSTRNIMASSGLRLPWSVPRLNLISPTPPPPAMLVENLDVLSDREEYEKTSTSPRSTQTRPKDTKSESTPRKVDKKLEREPIIDKVVPANNSNDDAEHFPSKSHAQPAKVEKKHRDHSRTVESPPARIPGQFEDDLDFAATLAAGLEDTGFDPAIVVDDPTFHRRASPPGSEDSGTYRTTFTEGAPNVSDIGIPSSISGVPMQRGFLEGELSDDLDRPTPDKGIDAKKPSSASFASIANKARKTRSNSEKHDTIRDVIPDLEKDKGTRPRPDERSSPSLERYSGLKNDYDDSGSDEGAAIAAVVHAVADHATGHEKNVSSSRRTFEPEDVLVDSFRKGDERAQPNVEPGFDQHQPNGSGFSSLPAATSTHSKDALNMINKEGDLYENKEIHKSSVAEPITTSEEAIYGDLSQPRQKETTSKSSHKADEASGQASEVASELALSISGQTTLPQEATYDDFAETRKKGKKSKRRRGTDQEPSSLKDKTQFVSDLSERTKGERSVQGDEREDRKGRKSEKRKHRKESLSESGRSTHDRTSKEVPGSGIRNVTESKVEGPQQPSPMVQPFPHEHKGPPTVIKEAHLTRKPESERVISTAEQKESLEPSSVFTSDQSTEETELSQVTIATQPFPSLSQSRSSSPVQVGSLIDLPALPASPHSRPAECFSKDFPSLPESRPSSPIEVGSIHDLPDLPPSRPESPFYGDSSAGRRISTFRTPDATVPAKLSSPTAIPLLFRRPPSSPGVQRSASVSSPSSATQTSVGASPRPRHGKSSSTEYKRSSREFRPLYLVERHKSRQDIEQDDEVYPSLPSSRTSTRSPSLQGKDDDDAFEMHENDRFVLDDVDVDEPRRGLRHDMSINVAFQGYPDDYLGSQQATPKATSFREAVFPHEQDHDVDLDEGALIQDTDKETTFEVATSGAHASPPRSPSRMVHSVRDLFPRRVPLVTPSHASALVEPTTRYVEPPFDDSNGLPPLPLSRPSSPYISDASPHTFVRIDDVNNVQENIPHALGVGIPYQDRNIQTGLRVSSREVLHDTAGESLSVTPGQAAIDSVWENPSTSRKKDRKSKRKSRLLEHTEPTGAVGLDTESLDPIDPRPVQEDEVQISDVAAPSEVLSDLPKEIKEQSIGRSDVDKRDEELSYMKSIASTAKKSKREKKGKREKKKDQWEPIEQKTPVSDEGKIEDSRIYIESAEVISQATLEAALLDDRSGTEKHRETPPEAERITGNVSQESPSIVNVVERPVEQASTPLTTELADDELAEPPAPPSSTPVDEWAAMKTKGKKKKNKKADKSKDVYFPSAAKSAPTMPEKSIDALEEEAPFQNKKNKKGKKKQKLVLPLFEPNMTLDSQETVDPLRNTEILHDSDLGDASYISRDIPDRDNEGIRSLDLPGQLGPSEQSGSKAVLYDPEHEQIESTEPEVRMTSQPVVVGYEQKGTYSNLDGDSTAVSKYSSDAQPPIDYPNDPKTPFDAIEAQGIDLDKNGLDDQSSVQAEFPQDGFSKKKSKKNKRQQRKQTFDWSEPGENTSLKPVEERDLATSESNRRLATAEVGHSETVESLDQPERATSILAKAVEGTVQETSDTQSQADRQAAPHLIPLPSENDDEFGILDDQPIDHLPEQRSLTSQSRLKQENAQDVPGFVSTPPRTVSRTPEQTREGHQYHDVELAQSENVYSLTPDQLPTLGVISPKGGGLDLRSTATYGPVDKTLPLTTASPQSIGSPKVVSTWTTLQDPEAMSIDSQQNLPSDAKDDDLYTDARTSPTPATELVGEPFIKFKKSKKEKRKEKKRGKTVEEDEIDIERTEDSLASEEPTQQGGQKESVTRPPSATEAWVTTFGVERKTASSLEQLQKTPQMGKTAPASDASSSPLPAVSEDPSSGPIFQNGLGDEDIAQLGGMAESTLEGAFVALVNPSDTGTDLKVIPSTDEYDLPFVPVQKGGKKKKKSRKSADERLPVRNVTQKRQVAENYEAPRMLSTPESELPLAIGAPRDASARESETPSPRLGGSRTVRTEASHGLSDSEAVSYSHQPSPEPESLPPAIRSVREDDLQAGQEIAATTTVTVPYAVSTDHPGRCPSDEIEKDGIAMRQTPSEVEVDVDEALDAHVQIGWSSTINTDQNLANISTSPTSDTAVGTLAGAVAGAALDEAITVSRVNKTAIDSVESHKSGSFNTVSKSDLHEPSGGQSVSSKALEEHDMQREIESSLINRDSAVHVHDTPTVSDRSPWTPYGRDSGYHEAEESSIAIPDHPSPSEPVTQTARSTLETSLNFPISPELPTTELQEIQEEHEREQTPDHALLKERRRYTDTSGELSEPLDISVEVDPAFEPSVEISIHPEVSGTGSIRETSSFRRKRSMTPAPSSEEQRQPSPVDSTSKNRSSGLFRPSPSIKEKAASPPLSIQRPDTFDRSHEQSPHTPRQAPDHIEDSWSFESISPKTTTSPLPQPPRSRKDKSVLEDLNSTPPSLFGGPIGYNSDIEPAPMFVHSHTGSEKRPLDTIVEQGLEESPSAKRTRSRAGVDRSSPSPAMGTSPIGRHLTSASPAASGEGHDSLLSTDDLISRMSWPSVDDKEETVDISREHRSPRSPNRHDYSAMLVPEQGHAQEFERRSPSGQSVKSNNSSVAGHGHPRTPDGEGIRRPATSSTNRSASGTPPLRRVDRSASGDLRAARRRGQARLAKEDQRQQQQQQRSRDRSLDLDVDSPDVPSSSTYDPVTDKGKNRARDMADVYAGWGDVQGSPLSPTRPPSMRRRQSTQILELEARMEQLGADNRQLQDAKSKAERSLEDVLYNHNRSSNEQAEALEMHRTQLGEREQEIGQLRVSLDSVQNEVSRLIEINAGLTTANASLASSHDERYELLHAEHTNRHRQLEESTREMDEWKNRHGELEAGMEELVRHEISIALQDKNAEVGRLRSELDTARDQIRALQREILEAKSGDDMLVSRDEDYFESACQELCKHVQSWVQRFSKFSDMRGARLADEVTDEKIVDRLENAILDGSDVDAYLNDRVKRRDVFMSVVMTMVWEFVFTRYLFGMDREQRQKLKSLEKTLTEVGPMAAVHKWRATTLILLSKREAFQTQRVQDTEAVVQEVYHTLAAILPPPSNLEQQIVESLRKVMQTAVDISIEMRTQRAEYMMLPPLQPEYDTNGELARKVSFNASLMNERSGDSTSNEELEEQEAIVRMVLFPLVVKKGDDSGVGDEEIVVCPAQVLVAKAPKDKKVVRVLSGDRMSIDQPRRSLQSITPSTLDMGNMI
ncbi:MAG: hypothetical protein M1833_003444 [Piccolia ochrophora]|nr:MAG: hypothetical protein M1833_003444 [Piccolia ochrophora]